MYVLKRHLKCLIEAQTRWGTRRSQAFSKILPLIKCSLTVLKINLKMSMGLKGLDNKTSLKTNTNGSLSSSFNWHIHSKTPGSAWPGKGSVGVKLHSGSTMTRKSVNLTRNMTQNWVSLAPLFVNLTDFRVTVDPEWSLAPTDPFPGHGWPGCF